MTDWSTLARARGLDIPADAVERIALSLQALEDAFRPLLKKLTHEVEPAITLSEATLSETAVSGE